MQTQLLVQLHRGQQTPLVDGARHVKTETRGGGQFRQIGQSVGRFQLQPFAAAGHIQAEQTKRLAQDHVLDPVLQGVGLERCGDRRNLQQRLL
ncbi:hypothetical protein D9M69_709940 [compost metagenome]